MATTDNEKIVAVNEGATYERKNAQEGQEGTRVVAFHVDRPRSTVLFAPLGSGREDRATIDDFLRDYKLIAQEGEPLPEDKKANATAARERSSRTTETAAPHQDNTTGNATRTHLEARAAARNGK
jgi:hypothetical protein